MAFNGGGFAYAHLVTARARGGPHVPLRDVWSTNLSMLAATYNVEESIGLQIPAMGEKTHRHWPLTQWKGRAMDKCMAPSGHAAYSAFRILEDHTVRKPGGAITLDDLPPRGPKHAAKRRKFLYLRLVESEYEKARSGKGVKTSVDSKIGRFVAGARPGRHFAEQAANTAGALSPSVWNTQLRLMHNALPFDRRRLGAKMIFFLVLDFY